MFGHSFIPPSSQNTEGMKDTFTPKPRISVRGRDGVPTQIRTQSPSPQRTRSPSTVQKQKHFSPRISERFCNRDYNRLPSPMSRFQRPGSAREDPPRPATPSRPKLQRATPSASRSDVLRQRGLESERPRTAEHPVRRVGKPLAPCPSLENRVFLTVKDVLSKAVLEKGRIDENNIETIIQDMQTRLNIEDDEEEEEPRNLLDLEKKTSKTSVNVNNSGEDESLKKQKPFEFVRRKLEPRKAPTYRRIYNTVELSENKAHGKVSFREDEKVVYVDLPDPDYSNFNSLVRSQNERMKENEVTVSRKDHQTDTAEDNIPEEMVGDYKTKHKCSEIWRSAEEAKLQKYIESLIKNMNNQLSGDQAAQEIEGEIKENTYCKSICVCKVCVSNRTSKSTLQARASQTDAVKKSGSRLRNSVKSSNISLDLSKPRKNIDKASNTETSRMNFRVLKKNQNFQPDSKVSISSRTVVSNPSTKRSFTVVDTSMDEEAGDDLYLQRRISRAPIGRRTSRM